MPKPFENPYSEENLRQLNKKLGTSINPDLLKIAISTRQAQNEHPAIITENNEKLELLGDSVLKLVIAETLFDKEETEAELTILRSKLENNFALAGIAHELDIKQHLFLGGGEKRSVGKGEGTLLANVFEALIGAIYRGQGLDESRRFIEKQVLPKLLRVNGSGDLRDPVTCLQEICQGRYGNIPLYSYTQLSGTRNEPLFRASVSINGEVVAFSEGSSKKEARLDASKKALASM